MNIDDDMGNSALLWASMADQYECVSALLKEGAIVNKANKHGYVSLMCAARKGDDQWLSDLIRAGADVNRISKLGETAFIIASSKNHQQCMSILRQEGVDVNTSHVPSSDSISQGGADVNTSHIPPSDLISQEMETNQINGDNQVNTVLTGDVVFTEEEVETSRGGE